MSQKIVWGERVPRVILPHLETERGRAFRREERERRDRLEHMRERQWARERARERRRAKARERREERRVDREWKKEERHDRIHHRRLPRMEVAQRPGRDELLRGRDQIWQELERNARERGIEMPPLPDRLPLFGSLARERLAESRINEIVRRGKMQRQPDRVMEREIAREERKEQRERIKIERELAKAEQKQEAQERMVVEWIEDMLMKGEFEHVDGDGVSYTLDTPGEFIDKWEQIRERRGLPPLNDRTRQKIYAMDWPGLRRAVKVIRRVELPGEVKRPPRRLREAPPGFEASYVDIYGRPTLRRKGVFFKKDEEEETVAVISPEGIEGTIPVGQLGEALLEGFKLDPGMQEGDLRTQYNRLRAAGVSAEEAKRRLGIE